MHSLRVLFLFKRKPREKKLWGADLFQRDAKKGIQVLKGPISKFLYIDKD